MLPRTQAYQLSGSGDTHAGLFEDIGTRSLQTVRVGEGAGKISSGVANAFVGYEAGKENTGGSFDTFIGYQAGSLNTQASYCTMIGAFAGRQNANGSEVVFIGYRAGELNKDGRSVVAIGSYAMRENVSGTGSVAIGYRAAERTLDGDYNVMVGTESGQDNRSGNLNTMCGFRSGRAAFRGNENTYFGAYSGHSNSHGSGNCFIGYKSGMKLELGDYNVAIGAYALENAYNGSCNIAIGPFAGAFASSGANSVLIGNQAAAFNEDGNNNVVIGTSAGSSNRGSDNVLIGAFVAKNSETNKNVIIGSHAANYASGVASVILGYNAGNTLRAGSSNLLIGTGADTYYTNVNNAIAIGNHHTYTGSYGISVGQDIENQREFSILVGFGLQSDANNSILMGNEINIQSVIFFKDPLTYTFVNAIKADGELKVGLSNVIYGYSNQLLVSPCNEIYTTAIAGLYTSNVYNSTDNRKNNRVSPASFDVRDIVHPLPHICFQGMVYPLLSNEDIKQYIPLSGFLDAANDVISPNVQHIYQITNNIPDLLHYHTCNITLNYYETSNFNNAILSNVVTNIRAFNTSNSIFPIEIVKRFAAPIANYTYCNVEMYHTALIQSTSPLVVPLMISSNMVSWTPHGIISSNEGILEYVVTNQPNQGILESSIYYENDIITYRPYHENLFGVEDVFEITPILKIVDANQNSYGIPSTSNIRIRIEYTNSNHQPLFRDTYVNTTNIYLTSNDFFRIPNYVSSDVVKFLELDSGSYIHYDNLIYSSNDVDWMKQEDIWSYPDNVYTSYLHDIHSNMMLITSCNENQVQNIFASFTSQIFNEIYSFSNTNIPPLDPNDDIVLGIYGISNVTSQITSCNIHTVPHMLTDIYASIASWSNTYDAENIYSNTDNLLTLYHSMSNVFYSYDWITVQNECLVYESSLASFIYTASNSSNILDQGVHVANVGLACNLPDVFVNDLFEEIENSNLLIKHKYFEIPRLFLSYQDIQQSNVLITTGLSNTQITFAIDNEIGTFRNVFACNMQWETISFTEISSSYHRSNILRSLHPPHLMIDKLYLTNNGSHGTFNYTGVDTDLSNTSFLLFDPYARNDHMNFVVSSNQLWQDIHWSITYIGTLYQPHVYCITDDPTQTIQTQSVLYKQASNEIHIFSTNTTITSNIDVQNTLTVSTAMSNTTFDVTYDSLEGYIYYNAVSNVLQSNVFYLSHAEAYSHGLDFVYTYFSYIGSNYAIDNSLTINLFSSNVAHYTSNYTDVTSNIVNYTNIHETRYYKAQTSITSNITDADLIIQDYIGLHDPSYYLYTDIGTIQERTVASNAVSYPIPAEGIVYNTCNYYYIRSNIHFQEPLCQITRNMIYAPSNLYSTDSVHIVRSNVGVIHTFSQDDIENGEMWIRLNQLPQDHSIYVYTSNESFPITVHTFHASNTVLLSTKTSNISVNIQNQYTTKMDQIGNPNVWNIPFDPDYLHIESVEKGCILNASSNTITRIPVSDLSNSFYLCTSNYENDTIKFFYSENQNVSELITCFIHIERSPYTSSQSFSTGLNLQSNILSDRGFLWNIPAVHASNVEIRVTSSNAYIPNIFTMQNVKDGAVLVGFSNQESSVFIYDVYDKTHPSVPYVSSKEFGLEPFIYHDFPRITNHSNVLQISVLGNQSNIQNVTQGPMWDHIHHLKVQNKDAVSSNFFLHVAHPFAHGFLWNSRSSNVNSHMFSLHDLEQGVIHYVPYDPSFIPNETFTMNIVYDSFVSPSYSVDLKNYISRFPISSPCVSAYNRPNQELPRNTGMVQDHLIWEPSSIHIPYQRSTPLTLLSNVMFISNIHNDAWIQQPHVASYPVYVTADVTFEIFVDQADSTILHALSNHVQYDLSKSDEVRFYVVQKGLYGYIQNTLLGQSVTSFTIQDLQNGNIVYQHIGNTTTQDRVLFVVSSTPYDVAFEKITMDIVIRPLPRISQNKESFVYYTTIFNAVNGSNSFASNIDITNGYVHVIGSNHLDIYMQDTVTKTIHTSNMYNATANYQLLPSLFDNGSNAPYDTMSLFLHPNNYSTYHVNSLIHVHPLYFNSFVTNYEVELNKYINSNVLVAKQNRYQRLQYTLDPSRSGYSNLKDKVFSYFFQFNPHQPFEPGKVDGTALQESRFLRTFDFDVNFIDQNDSNLVSMSFRDDYIFFSSSGCNLQLSNPEGLRFEFNKWDNVLFVNQDPENKLNTSLYIQYDITKSRNVNESKNILRNYHIPYVDMNALKHVMVDIDLESERNSKGSSYRLIRELGSSNGMLDVMYELAHYSTALYFRNQEISISTYTASASTSEIDIGQIKSSTVHNVVLGKNIIVRGTNNICIGNRFNTSGQNSIILGNDIGVETVSIDTTQINDIYQSIIIGNRSFQNSIVRDIISIGNENFNQLYLSPISQVNEFLAQKPILIGNSITEDTLDFHVNIGNTFLKTNVQGEKIYLGKAHEVVGIGYTSNTSLTTNHVLHVNGSLTSTKVHTDAVDSRKYIMTFYTYSNIIPSNVPVSALGIFVEVNHVSHAIVAQAYLDDDPRYVGICIDCRPFALYPDMYEVTVQTAGLARVLVQGPLYAGDLISCSNVGIGYRQNTNIRYGYSFAKSLETNISSTVILAQCLLLG